MNNFFKVTGIISTSILVWIWFNACIYLSIAAHTLYPDSVYASAYNSRAECLHVYLIIDGEPKDPQFLFLWLSPNVDYNNPKYTFRTTKELLNVGYMLIPGVI